MKKAVIAGAGQFGRACSLLLSADKVQLTAFADNNPNLQGTDWIHPMGMRIPICSMKDALRTSPDLVLTGVIDKERTLQLTEQLRTLGYRGEIRSLRDIAGLMDVRDAVLWRLADRIKEAAVQGEVAELGVYRGDFSQKLNALFPDRSLYLFDTFEGFDERDMALEESRGYSRPGQDEFRDTGIDVVREKLPFPDKVIFRKGYFPDTAADLPELKYAFISLDADLYAPILAGLRYFVPRLSPGGAILLHDYNNARFSGAKKAVEEYERLHGLLNLVPLCDLHGSAVILGSAQA